MANAVSGGDFLRHIIVGVDEQGRVHNAPYLFDEARIQQYLAMITPVPHVALLQHEVGGNIISVLTIGPPFDRPYVAKIGNQNTVWVRMGSRIGTASRSQLDTFYAAKHALRRAPRIEVAWGLLPLSEDESSEPASDDIPWDEVGLVQRIVLPAPTYDAAQEVVDAVKEDLQYLTEEAEKHPNAPQLAQAISKFTKEARRFLDWIANADRFEAWYLGELAAIKLRNVVFQVENVGDAVASDIVIRIELPAWLGAFRGSPPAYEGPRRPKNHEVEFLLMSLSENGTRRGLSSIFAQTQALASFATSNSIVATFVGNEFATTLKTLEMARVHLSRSYHIDVENGEVYLDADELVHKHIHNYDEAITLIALPGAPRGEHELTVSVFHRELPDYESRKLIIEIS